MTEIEAGEFVTRLIGAYPGVKFTEQNAKAYQSLLVNLDAGEAETARLELAETSKFIPSYAEIREVVMRNRRQRRALQSSEPKPLSLAEIGMPSPHVWASKLTDMLEDSARWHRMTEKFCRERGLPMPKDPGQQFIDIARDGASGKDVSQRLKREVFGEAEELERRFP